MSVEVNKYVDVNSTDPASPGGQVIADIEAAGAQQIALVNEAGTNGIAGIANAKDGAEQSITIIGDGKVVEIEQAGQIQVDRVIAEGDTQYSRVVNAGTDEVLAITEAGATNEALVNDAGTAGVALVNAAAAGLADSFVAVLVPVYQTLAAATAAFATTIADGQRFAVEAANGPGVYYFRRSGSGFVFLNMGLIGVRGQKIATARGVSRSLQVVRAMPAQFTLNAWGLFSQEWDGRAFINTAGTGLTVPPTLNLLPDPFTPQDEEGNATPARVSPDPTIVDPAGGFNATRLTYSAALQPLVLFRAADDDLPVGDYRPQSSFITVSGATPAYRIGATNTAGNYNAFTATGAWVSQNFTITGYDNSTKNFDISITSGTGNLDGVVGVYAVALYDVYAGVTLPTPAQELAANLSVHGKKAAAYPNSIKFSATDYSIDVTTPFDGLLFNFGPQPIVLSGANGMTFGGWINCTALPTTTYGAGLGVDYHDATVNSAIGMMGVAPTGLPYCIPNYSTMTGKATFNFLGAGMNSFFVTIKNGENVPYLNGVPVFRATAVWGGYNIQRLIALAYNGLNKRRKVTNLLRGYFDGAAFAPIALTGADITKADAHGRDMLRLSGGGAAPRKICAIGIGDSMTAFTESYFWATGADATIPGRVHGFVEAVGGSNVDNWIARAAFLDEQIAAADRAGYEEIWLFALVGANEIDYWKDHPVGGNYDFNWWLANKYLPYINARKAVSSKVKVLGLPMCPRSGYGGAPYTAASLAAEACRNAWNAFLVATPAAAGANAVIDWRADTMLQYATSAAACDSVPGATPPWNNPTPDVTKYQTGGTHVTTLGGQLLAAWVIPWLKARLATLQGIV